MSNDNRLTRKLRPTIYKNTLLAVVAYFISAVIAFGSVFLELSYYGYKPFLLILAFVTLSNLCFLIVTKLRKNITKSYSKSMVKAQLFVWFIAFIATIYYTADLRVLMLMASVMAFTFAVSFLTLKVSIYLVFLSAFLYLAISYVGIELHQQRGSFSYEVLVVMCYLPVCCFVSYMADRIKRQRKLLKEAVVSLKSAREERELIMVKLEKAASTDDLTGLMNRRAINKELQHEHSLVKRYQSELTIILADIDHFKQINDTYGHDCGDAVLKNIALVLQDSIRDTDFAARWGGEEFLIVLPNTKSSSAKVLAERLLKNIENLEVAYQDKTINFTISAGLHQASPEQTIEDAIKTADAYLYTAKEHGRNCVVDGVSSS